MKGIAGPRKSSYVAKPKLPPELRGGSIGKGWAEDDEKYDEYKSESYIKGDVDERA